MNEQTSAKKYKYKILLDKESMRADYSGALIYFVKEIKTYIKMINFFAAKKHYMESNSCPEFSLDALKAHPLFGKAKNIVYGPSSSILARQIPKDLDLNLVYLELIFDRSWCLVENLDAPTVKVFNLVDTSDKNLDPMTIEFDSLADHNLDTSTINALALFIDTTCKELGSDGKPCNSLTIEFDSPLGGETK